MRGRRELTFRQRTFVEEILSGNTKVGAYRKAYSTERSKPSTVYRNSKLIASNPVIQAEIQALSLLRFPQASDHVALWEQAVSVFFKLSDHGKSERVRLEAAIWLMEVAQARLALQRGVEVEGVEALSRKLCRLYKQALTIQKQDAEGASETDAALGRADSANATSESHDEVCSASGIEAGEMSATGEEDSSADSEMHVPSSTDGAARPDPLAPSRRKTTQDAYEWQTRAVPGHFPPRLQRVRVRIR